MKRFRLVAWVPVLFLAVLGGLTAWLNRAVQSGGVLGPVNLSTPDIIVEDLDAIKYNADGTRMYVLTAKRFEHRPDEDSTRMVEPLMVQFHPDESEVRVRSNHAYVSRDASEVIFTGDVRIERTATDIAGPVVLTTSYLTVYPDEGIARSDKEVVIRGDDGTLKGVGLEFNNKTRQMRLQSRVRGQFKNPRSESSAP